MLKQLVGTVNSRFGVEDFRPHRRRLTLLPTFINVKTLFMENENGIAKKLVLNKKTIARLNENQMTLINGGGNTSTFQPSDESCACPPHPISDDDLTAWR
jgi:hypothetical protein